MRPALPFLLILALAGCGAGLDLRGAVDPGQAARRGAVELAVKGSFPGILDEIGAGGGPALTRAFDVAGVPLQDRPGRVIQLAGDLGLYEANPGALVTALVVYGRSAA